MNKMLRQRLKNRAASMRHQARQKLEVLLERDGNKCYWCSIRLFLPGELPKGVIRESGKVVLRRGDDVFHLITVDHLKGCFKEDSNDAANLVLSCGPCNSRRHKSQHPDDKRKKKKDYTDKYKEQPISGSLLSSFDVNGVLSRIWYQLAEPSKPIDMKIRE